MPVVLAWPAGREAAPGKCMHCVMSGCCGTVGDSLDGGESRKGQHVGVRIHANLAVHQHVTLCTLQAMWDRQR